MKKIEILTAVSESEAKMMIETNLNLGYELVSFESVPQNIQGGGGPIGNFYRFNYVYRMVFMYEREEALEDE